MRRTEVHPVYEARDVVRLTSYEDRRMWRLLLARLHPDAGGDNDLFTFACAVRDEVYGEEDPAEGRGTGEQADAASFLGAWHEEMGRWSSSNRDALSRF
jgi:hypothetical protein